MKRLPTGHLEKIQKTEELLQPQIPEFSVGGSLNLDCLSAGPAVYDAFRQDG